MAVGSESWLLCEMKGARGARGAGSALPTQGHHPAALREGSREFSWQWHSGLTPWCWNRARVEPGTQVCGTGSAKQKNPCKVAKDRPRTKASAQQWGKKMFSMAVFLETHPEKLYPDDFSGKRSLPSLWSLQDNGTDKAGWILLHMGNADKLGWKHKTLSLWAFSLQSHPSSASWFFSLSLSAGCSQKHLS